MLATTTHWSLIHEAVHGHLVPGKNNNLYSGRGLAILFGAPFRMLRFGHLSHHRISRGEQDRVEVFDPEKFGHLRFSIGYFCYISIGLFLVELFFSLIVLAPKPIVSMVVKSGAGPLWPQAQKELLESGKLREMRIDGAIILLLFALSFAAYGSYWPLLVLALLLRGVQSSVANASYHYATPLNETRFAHNFELPPILARLILNFNFHHVHHVYPGLPWNGLAEAFEKNGFTYDTDYLHGMVRQFRGPIEIHDLPLLEH